MCTSFPTTFLEIAVFEVTYVCQFSKGAGLLVKAKQKKLVENVFTTYLEDRRELRETTYIDRTLIRSLYEDTTIQCPPALPPIQVTRNNKFHVLTIFVSVSLDTGFLASAVKHL